MPVPDPVAFTIFNLDIMWYAILICIGIVLGTALCCYRAPKHGLTADQVLNFVVISVPAGIIGARLYYVLFHWDWYAGDFFKIINTRAGGLAIHGGLIAGLGTAAILCKLWKVRPLNLLDLLVPSIALGQAIGRWGNYFNSEAHGGPTDLPWAITVDGQSVHPTFLYESIWCFFLFLLLLWLDRNTHIEDGTGPLDSGSGKKYKKKKKGASAAPQSFEGRLFLIYGMLYSLERFFVEALRTDSLMLGPFKQAQLISLTTFVVCAVAYFYLRRRHLNNQ